MTYIALGAFGLLLACLLEHPRLANMPFLKPPAGLAVLGLMSYSVTMVAMWPDRFQIPPPISWVAWFFFMAFSLLFIYSVFIEVRFNQSRTDMAEGSELVRTGTYALTRHPGVIWITLALVSLVLATRSWLLLIATPIWLLMDLIWVWIEDRFYFPQMFPDYNEYKKEVPMLIPTSASIRNCIRTIRLQARREVTE